MFEVCNVCDFSGVVAERMNFFAEARKRLTKGKSIEVIDLEPLASVEPKGKNVVTLLKRKADVSTPRWGTADG